MNGAAAAAAIEAARREVVRWGETIRAMGHLGQGAHEELRRRLVALHNAACVALDSALAAEATASDAKAAP